MKKLAVCGCILLAIFALTLVGWRQYSSRPHGNEILRWHTAAIKRDDLKYMQSYLTTLAGSQGRKLSKIQIGRASLLQLYQYMVVEREADRRGISPDQDKVDLALRTLKANCCEGSDAQWRAHLRDLGTRERLIRRDLEHQDLVRQLSTKIRKETKTVIAEKDLRASFKAQGGGQIRPRSRQAFIILINERPYDTFDQTDQRLTADVYRRLQAGEDRTALADRYSQLAGNKTKGHVREVLDDEAEWPAAIRHAVFNTPKGSYASPLCLPDDGYVGCYIVMPMSEITPAHPVRFEDVEDILRSQLADEQRENAPALLIRKLMLEGLDEIHYAASYKGPRMTRADVKRMFAKGLLHDGS
jgi:hypothetical protein